MSSRPESLRGLGITGHEFQRRENRRVSGDPKIARILISKEKRNSLLKVVGYLVQIGALGNHGQFKALGDIPAFFPWSNDGLHRSLGSGSR